MNTLGQQQDLNSLDTNKVNFQPSKLIEPYVARFSNRILIRNRVLPIKSCLIVFRVSLVSVAGTFGYFEKPCYGSGLILPCK